MGNPWRPVQRVHVNNEMTGVLTGRLDCLFPTGKGWRQAARFQMVGAELIDAAHGPGLNGRQEGEGSITFHAQRGYNATRVEWIDAQERTETLGCQLFCGLKAAQQQQPPEFTDLGSPATEKLACRIVLAYESTRADPRLRQG
jgi:hypothetical protein